MVSRKKLYEPFEDKHIPGRRRITLVDSLSLYRNRADEDSEFEREIKDYIKSHYDGGWVAPKDDEESSEEI